MKRLLTIPLLSEKEARNKLSAIDESGLIDHWSGLNQVQQSNLLRSITHLDKALLKHQKAHLLQSHTHKLPFERFIPDFFSGNEADYQSGKEAMKEGRCACLILAGGQGSRLNFQGPKGCCPITNIKKKTLFQLLAEKIQAASIQVGTALQVAIMTSPFNHFETEYYFIRNGFFGLDPGQVTFFCQRMWPFLNLDGHVFLENPDTIAFGPNGNGGVFHRFIEVGLWQKWEEMGIEMVNVIPVDNPLALPYDHELFGFQQRMRSDVVIKVGSAHDLEEKVGRVVKVNGKIRILEYFELTEAEKNQLTHTTINLGLYSFSMSFIKRIGHLSLPLHRTKKIVRHWRAEVGYDQTDSWKFEEFIFDLLPFADHCEALLYPRDIVFAPLKNLTGEDSRESVKKALLNADRKRYTSLTGIKPNKTVFELSPSFYYPTDSFLKSWRGKPLPNYDYIKDIE
ncbi:MAG: UTP--glucose-1-phosphate uridylyltransferase [Chlamydiales bacterium]